MLKTETPSSQHRELDQYPIEKLVAAFADDQLNAVQAVRAAVPAIAKAVEAAVPRIEAGGLFRHEWIEELFRRHLAGAGSHAWTLWNVLAVTTWQEIVGEESGKHLWVRAPTPLHKAAC